MSLGSRVMLMAAGVTALAVALPAQQPPFDVLLTGGQVLDGSGGAAQRVDVGIRGDRVAAIGQLAGQPARRTIDATGLVVAPGFIDLHTHSEMPLIADGTAQSKVRQGVTLDITGESTSAAPRDHLEETGQDGLKPDWRTFTEYFARLERQGISINTIAHVASEQVRRVVMGYDRAPSTAAQRKQMTDFVARSMEEGAWGLVTRFESGGPEHPEEVLDMARTVARYGGNYTTHAGSEGYEQAREFDYAIRVAAQAKLPVHIFHFKVRGVPLWGTIDKYIAQLEAARGRGLDVTANQYPYTAMFHGWSAFFPLWMREGGPAQFAARLKDPAARERLEKDKDFAAWIEEHGGWTGIALARARTEKNRQYEANGSPRSRSCAATPIRWTPASTSWRRKAARSAASSTRCPRTTSARSCACPGWRSPATARRSTSMRQACRIRATTPPTSACWATTCASRRS
jgi:dihydroorotase/N-acyl-D-amino-acid deacylase